MSVASLFILFTCDCCGRTIAGDRVYRAGLRMCVPCGEGQHRHPRTPALA